MDNMIKRSTKGAGGNTVAYKCLISEIPENTLKGLCEGRYILFWFHCISNFCLQRFLVVTMSCKIASIMKVINNNNIIHSDNKLYYHFQVKFKQINKVYLDIRYSYLIHNRYWWLFWLCPAVLPYGVAAVLLYVCMVLLLYCHMFVWCCYCVAID